MPRPTSHCRNRDKVFADEVRRAMELCHNLRAIFCAIQLSSSDSTAAILSAIQNQPSLRSIKFHTVGNVIQDLACRNRLESLSFLHNSPTLYVALSGISPSVVPSLTSLNIYVRLYGHFSSPTLSNNLRNLASWRPPRPYCYAMCYLNFHAFSVLSSKIQDSVVFMI
jgi:hypothetical protein